MKRCVAGAALVVAALLATGCAGDEPADEVTLPAPVTGTAGGTATPGTAPTVPLGELEVALIPIAEVDEPVAMTVHPTTGNLYVAEQGGAVREIIVDRDDGAVTYRLTPEPVLDLSAATDSRGE